MADFGDGSVSCTRCGAFMCHVPTGHGLMECDLCSLRRHEDSLPDERIQSRDGSEG